MHRMAAILALVGCTAACGPTLQELQNEPVRFSIAVPISWDRMSTCLKAANADDFGIVDLPVAAERRTELLLYMTGGPGQRINLAAFDIRGTADNASTVVYRRRKSAFFQEAAEQSARAQVERCANF